MSNNSQNSQDTAEYLVDGKYLPTIGLEIHAELKTESKMFSASKNDPDEIEPNKNINPIDVGHPGTLPTMNKKAIESMIQIGLSVGGEIANFTEFDRKNYFYPDIPKGYQITQYKYPIVSGGKIAGIELTRIHLEEDTGLSKHDRGDFSLVDFNRAGVPLMELVTEPVIHTAEEAVTFARELQLLLRYLGVGDANMEKGEMRVEANISVSSDTSVLGTKVEVKNLNSFRSVEKAIDFEIKRMIALIEAGKKDEIVQETRGWDENKQKTFSQRKKETSDDYRYFPEPDLPKLYLHELFDLEVLRADLPTLPWEKRAWYVNGVGLSPEATQVLVTDIALGKFFDEVTVDKSDDVEFSKKAGNYITSDMVSLLKDGGTLPQADHMRTLIEMIMVNEVSSRGAKDILAMLVQKSEDPKMLAEKHGLLQKSNEEELVKIVDALIAEHTGVVEEYKSGKENALQFLVGQGMKATKGSANPQILKEIFLKQI